MYVCSIIAMHPLGMGRYYALAICIQPATHVLAEIPQKHNTQPFFILVEFLHSIEDDKIYNYI
jgi:hypothetical protein